MPAKYRSFEETEQNGTRYVIAQPSSERDSPVRLEGTLFEGEELDDGTWTEVVGRLIQVDIAGALNLEAGKGKLSRSEAVESILEADEEGLPIHVGERAQAEALIDYFVDEGVFEAESGDLVLLRSPTDEATDINLRMLMNWVSAIDSCIDKIEETTATIEQARSELESEMTDTNPSEVIQDFERQQKEVAQKLNNLTGGRNVSRVEDLPEEERPEFRRLKEQFYHLQTMKEAASPDEMATQIEKSSAELATKRDRLENIARNLELKRDELRTAIVHEKIFPQDAVDMVQNLEGLVTSLTGVENSDDRAEQKSAGDVLSDANALLGGAEAAEEQAEQMGVGPDEEPETLGNT